MAKYLSVKTVALKINKEKRMNCICKLEKNLKLHYLAVNITANGNGCWNRLDIRLFKQQVTYIVTQSLKSTTAEIPYDLHKSINNFLWTMQQKHKITEKTVSRRFKVVHCSVKKVQWDQCSHLIKWVVRWISKQHSSRWFVSHESNHMFSQ